MGLKGLLRGDIELLILDDIHTSQVTHVSTVCYTDRFTVFTFF
jgi:hypothetical protein